MIEASFDRAVLPRTTAIAHDEIAVQLAADSGQGPIFIKRQLYTVVTHGELPGPLARVGKRQPEG